MTEKSAPYKFGRFLRRTLQASANTLETIMTKTLCRTRILQIELPTGQHYELRTPKPYAQQVIHYIHWRKINGASNNTIINELYHIGGLEGKFNIKKFNDLKKTYT